MTVVACFLAVGIVCMYFAHQRDIRALLDAHDFERERNEQATQGLLDRIQHPEVRQVEAGEYEDVVPPRDAAELQWVGEIVPEFVHVGDQEA